MGVAREIYKNILNGEFLHNDNAKYQLQLQVNRYGGRSILTRKDSMDIFYRIMIVPPLSGLPGIGVMAQLPEPIKQHVGDHKTFKIEWMLNGQYLLSMSDSYAENIMSEQDISMVAKKTHIPPKLVDYCGLSNWDMAYKMWVESLFVPCASVNFTGAGFWQKDGVVSMTTVRMMSVIIHHEYIITATTCGRGMKYTF